MTTTISCDAILCRLADGQDAKDWHDFVVCMGPTLYRCAYAVLGNDSGVDDVVQEALLTIRRKACRYRSEPEAAEYKARAWVWRTVMFTARNWKRSAQRRKHWEQHAAQAQRVFDDDQPNFLTSEYAVERKRLLHTALSRLRQSYQEVLILHYFEGLSHSDIAKSLGCSAEALRVRLHRATKALHKHLAGCGLSLSLAATGSVLSQLGAATNEMSLQVLAQPSHVSSLVSTTMQATAVPIQSASLLGLSVAKVLCVGGIVLSSAILIPFIAIEPPVDLTPIEAVTVVQTSEQSPSDTSSSSAYSRALAEIDVAALERRAMNDPTPCFTCRLGYLPPELIAEEPAFSPGVYVVNNEQGAVRCRSDFDLKHASFELLAGCSSLDQVVSPQQWTTTLNGEQLNEVSIEWQPLLHYFRRLPERYQLENPWQPAHERRDLRWDAHMLLAGSLRFSNPDMAWQALTKAREAGYPVDGYYGLLTIRVALQRNDFAAAADWLRQTQAWIAASPDDSDRSSIRGPLAALQVRLEQAYSTNGEPLYVQEQGLYVYPVTAEIMNNLINNAGSVYRYLLSSLRDAGAGVHWLWDRTCGTVPAGDWSCTLHGHLPTGKSRREKHRTQARGYLFALHNRKAKLYPAAIEIFLNGTVKVYESFDKHNPDAGSIRIIDDCGLRSESGTDFKMRLLKIGMRLAVFINDGLVAEFPLMDAEDIEIGLFRQSSDCMISEFRIDRLLKEPIAQMTDLLTAVRFDDGEAVRALIAAGADLRPALAAKRTLLHIAVLGNRCKALAALLVADVIPVDEMDGAGVSPLVSAANLGHLDCVRQLLNVGANVLSRSRNTTRSIALERAVKFNNAGLVTLLLQYGQATEQAQYQGMLGLSSLQQALIGDTQRVIIDRLLCASAGISQPAEAQLYGVKRLTLIHQLPIESRLYALLLHDDQQPFLEFCAALSEEKRLHYFNQSSLGPSLLHVAVNHRKHAAIKTLLDGGADVNALTAAVIIRVRTGRGGKPMIVQETPLHWAIGRTMDMKAVELLLAHGADPRLGIGQNRPWMATDLAQRVGMTWLIPRLEQIMDDLPTVSGTPSDNHINNQDEAEGLSDF